MTTILFVCTGNVCRSPMAAGFLKRIVHREGLDGRFKVLSAGTWSLQGEPASLYARQVMAERGIDISAHRACDLTREAVEEADLILVMSGNQKEIVERYFPESRGKTYLLSEIVGKEKDIWDPYGGLLEPYRRCADELEGILEEGYERIFDLTRPRPLRS